MCMLVTLFNGAKSYLNGLVHRIVPIAVYNITNDNVDVDLKSESA